MALKATTRITFTPHHADVVLPAYRPLQPRHEIRIVDALVEAYGDYIDANAPGIDLTLFKDVLFSAIDGNALYEIEQASQQLRDDLAERAYYARHNRSPLNDVSVLAIKKTDASTDLVGDRGATRALGGLDFGGRGRR